MNKDEVVKWDDHLAFGLYAFAGLGMELVLLILEKMIIGKPTSEFQSINFIIHWIMTCIVWGIVAFMLVKYSKKNNSFDVFMYRDKPNTKQIAISLLLLLITTTVSLVSWKGFKPYIELKRLGVNKFIFQYIYYIFEIMLVVLSIAFGQKAGEVRFNNSKVPWGGIFLGLTWGLVHILTQSLSTGIIAAGSSIIYGILYNLLNKNIRYVYFIILLMFLL